MKQTNNYFNPIETNTILNDVRKITNYSNIAFSKLEKNGTPYSKTYIIYVANGNSKSTIDPIMKVFTEMVKEQKQLISEAKSVFGLS